MIKIFITLYGSFPHTFHKYQHSLVSSDLYNAEDCASCCLLVNNRMSLMLWHMKLIKKYILLKLRNMSCLFTQKIRLSIARQVDSCEAPSLAKMIMVSWRKLRNWWELTLEIKMKSKAIGMSTF